MLRPRYRISPAFLLPGLVFCFTSAAIAAAPTTIDLRTLVSRADLHYAAPVSRSEDGMPIGNGRMGSLVWTSPTALRFQINRNDVQSISAGTNSFFERNTDYMGGCAFA